MPKLGRQTNFSGALDAVVVVRGNPSRVATWVERGTVPAYVVDLEGPWCAVVGAGPGHAQEPYRHAPSMLAGRPVPVTMRPALSFLVEGEHAVVSVQPRRWRALTRWFVVRRGFGPVRVILPQASLDDLLAAGHEAHPEALDRVLEQVQSAPVEILRGIMAALGVPAGHLLEVERDAQIDAELVHPAVKNVRRFDKHVDEEIAERSEIEERLTTKEQM